MFPLGISFLAISTTFVAILGITWKIGCYATSIHIYFGSSTMPDCGNCRLSKSPSSISCEIELPSESLAMHILYHYTIDINQLSFFFLFLVFRSLFFWVHYLHHHFMRFLAHLSKQGTWLVPKVGNLSRFAHYYQFTQE